VRLRLCARSRLSSIDFEKTMKTYNLCFWVGENYAYTYIPWSSVAVARVYYSGEYEVYSESCEEYLLGRLEWALGTREDLSEFYELASRDPLLGGLAEAFTGWRLRSCDLWWGLLVAVCQQNASFKQGWRMLHELVRACNKRVDLESTQLLRPPSPREILKEPEKLRRAGLGYRADTVLRVAEALEAGRLRSEDLARLDLAEAEMALRRIRGVGAYTARLALVLSARRYELPPLDRWLRRITSVVYGVSEREAEKYWSEKWGRWSGLASVAATIALDAEVLSRALERVKRGAVLPDPRVKPSPLNMAWFCEELL
jgi:N-glycosylase/DNA lyase